MEICKVLSRLISIARKALLLHRAIAGTGYAGTPYFDLYAETADAICILIGDKKDDYVETETFQALNDDNLSEALRLEKLMKVYGENAA